MKHSPRFLAVVDDAKSRVRECSCDDVKSRIDDGEAINLIDVREDREFNKAHIAGAKHLGKGVIERDVEAAFPDETVELILYCGGGYRSALAADVLQKMGYQNVVSMDGGWREWSEKNYPTES